MNLNLVSFFKLLKFILVQIFLIINNILFYIIKKTLLSLEFPKLYKST